MRERGQRRMVSTFAAAKIRVCFSLSVYPFLLRRSSCLYLPACKVKILVLVKFGALLEELIVYQL
jgi:hypothetical protein